MLTIWGRRNSMNVQKITWLVNELGLAYQRHDVGGSFGKVSTEEYKQMNPNARIPTLEEEGFILWESNAIVRYLASKHSHGSLCPANPATRALADQWMDWMQTTLGPDLFFVFQAMIRTPAAERDPDAVEKAAQKLGNSYRVLDQHLASRNYVAGAAFSMGDIPLGATCYRYFNMNISRPPLPHVIAWYERLQERPAYREHVMIPFGASPEEWLQLEQQGS